MNYLQQKTERILQAEEIKRARQKQMTGILDPFNFYDVKGEVFKLIQLMSELQRALNANDRTKILELCILSNQRLKLIYKQYK